MLAKNFNNERPGYNVPVILILKQKNSKVSSGYRTRTDAQGEIYLNHEGDEVNEERLLGWLPIPTEVERIHPTEDRHGS